MKTIGCHFTPLRAHGRGFRPRMAEARKRAILKRYLVINDIEGWRDSTSTNDLRLLLLHEFHQDLHWRMPNFYVTQLAACKAIWGQKTSLGVLDANGKSRQCYTVADLIDAGFVAKEFAYLESRVARVRSIYYNINNERRNDC